MRNELVGVVFADGEITSNLRWTQSIYDLFPTEVVQSLDPLDEDDVMNHAKSAIQSLLDIEPIVKTPLINEKFDVLLKEVKNLTNNETTLKAILKKADDEAKAYAKKHIKGKTGVTAE
jgi:CRISPR-associated protein Csc2